MDIMTTGTDEKVVIPDPDPTAAGIPVWNGASGAVPSATAAGVGYAQTTQTTQTKQPRLHGGRQFEGADISKTVTKISGAVEVDMGLEDVSIDDRVRVCGEFRVMKVNHYVAKDGTIIREQVLAPLADQTLQLVPFDSTNPNDNGIVRMR